MIDHIETIFKGFVLYLFITLILFISNYTKFAFTQEEQETNAISIKITSPVTGQRIPMGALTISGTSTDNTATDCTVYADWNDQKPFQKATATGPGGIDDYSTWAFTYTDKYHLITNGTNNLTSKLSCLNNPTNLTKWNSIDVIGEDSLTIPKNNNVTTGDLRTSFEGQNLTTLGNKTENITEESQTNTSLSNAPTNNNASRTMIPEDNATTAIPNNKTGNPIIDFFKGMFGS